MASPLPTLSNGSFLLDILKFVLPTILAIGAGYGATKFTAGAIEQRLINAENQIIEIKQSHMGFVTREELRAYLDGQTRALDRIADDLRAIRSGR
jgi:hypothetical protein